MARRSNFLAQLKRNQQPTTPAEKPISEMSEQELDAEEARLRGELRRIREEGLEAARQEHAASSGNRRPFPKPKKRPPWK
jgi:hypothetical protein